MGEGNRVASVIMLTFTVGPGPHAYFYNGARPPCLLLQWGPAPILTQLGLWLASWLS